MKETMTTKEAAEYLCYKSATLEKWRKSNRGPKWRKPAHRVVYYKSDLDDWLKNERI